MAPRGLVEVRVSWPGHPRYLKKKNLTFIQPLSKNPAQPEGTHSFSSISNKKHCMPPYFQEKICFQGSEILPSQTLLVREPHFHLSLFSIIFQAEPRHFRRPPLDLHLADLSPPSSPLLPLLRGSTLLGKSGLVFPKLTKLLFI